MTAIAAMMIFFNVRMPPMFLVFDDIRTVSKDSASCMASQLSNFSTSMTAFSALFGIGTPIFEGFIRLSLFLRDLKLRGSTPVVI